MQRRDDSSFNKSRHMAWQTVFLLGFGLALLVFLTAIERQNWFHIRPASGTAMAMGYAAAGSADKRTDVARARPGT